MTHDGPCGHWQVTKMSVRVGRLEGLRHSRVGEISVSESVVSTFDRLVGARPPGSVEKLVGTACVLGGSVAGLLAARVLSDHAHRVVVIERDDVAEGAVSRPGTPHDLQVHTLLPAGGQWIERWFPGFTEEATRGGAVLATPATLLTTFDGHPQASSGADHSLLAASRPFLEAGIRARVAALPNVSVLRARAVGLRYRDDAVAGVVLVRDGVEELVDADFVVDAMGRASRVSEWVGDGGYDRPGLERLDSPINYATALFERATASDDLPVNCALSIFSAAHPADGVSVAAVNAVEGDQWLVMLMGYGGNRPGRTIEEFRGVCARLAPVFAEATAGVVTRPVALYHQQESRRRDFTGLGRFPARLVSVGDAVASFNPVYGQGMSSAALHASCLSVFLTDGPDLDKTAAEFFRLQQVVVDAAWMISAGGDMARRDLMAGVVPSADVALQREALGQIIGASLIDSEVARAFKSVSYMLRHPATLGDPGIMARAIAANKAGSPV